MTDSISVGDEVLWRSRHKGIVCHADGNQFGVELEHPVSEGHDGRGVFHGSPGCCIIVPKEQLKRFSKEARAAAIIAAAAKGSSARMTQRASSLAAFLKTLEEYKEMRMNQSRAALAARSRGSSASKAAQREARRRAATASVLFDARRLEGPSLPEGAFSMPLVPSALNSMLQGFKEGLVPHPAVALAVLHDAFDHFRSLPTVHTMRVCGEERFTVVGDLHGHLDSLFFLLQCNGAPSPSNKYIFNGDLVDRGPASLEVVLTVVGLALMHGPGSVGINRGNHEDADQNRMYCGVGGQHGHDMGFHLDCANKYGTRNGAVVYEACIAVFNALPLFSVIDAADVGRKAFVVHGGLFMEKAVTLPMLQRIHRFRPVPVGGRSLDDSLFVQAMWADPREMRGAAMNEVRGDLPCIFGESVTRDFCDRNGFDLIVRSHEAEMEGHRRWHGGRLVTIFSASGYVNVMRGSRAISNKGAVIVFNSELASRVDTFTAPQLEKTDPFCVDIACLGVAPDAADPATIDDAWTKQGEARRRHADEALEYSLFAAGIAPADLSSSSSSLSLSSSRPPPPPPRTAAPSEAPARAGSAAAAASRLRMPYPLNRTESADAEASAEDKAATRSLTDHEAARETIMDAVVERKTDLYWCFSTMDREHTGRLTFPQWCDGMQQCMPFEAPSWRMVNAEFELVDIGPDGCINYCRFLDRFVGDISPRQRSAQQGIMRSVACRLFQAVSEPTTEAVFHELDANGDGLIDFHEFVEGLEMVGVGLNRNQLVLLMHAIDTSMDGTISRQEFDDAFRVTFEPSSDAARAAVAAMSKDTKRCVTRIGKLMLKTGADLASLFGSMDVDGDGTLSFEEFATVLGQLKLKPPLTRDQIGSVWKVIDADASGSVDFFEFASAFHIEIRPSKPSPKAQAAKKPSTAGVPSSASASASSSSSAAAPPPPTHGTPLDRRSSVAVPISVGEHSRIDFLSAIFSDIAIRFKAHAGQLGVAFRLFDTDGDGVLSRDEFAHALESVGMDLEPEVLGAVMDAIDVDGDGAIDSFEFISALKTRDTERPRRPALTPGSDAHRDASEAAGAAKIVARPPKKSAAEQATRRLSLFTGQPQQ